METFKQVLGSLTFFPQDNADESQVKKAVDLFNLVVILGNLLRQSSNSKKFDIKFEEGGLSCFFLGTPNQKLGWKSLD